MNKPLTDVQRETLSYIKAYISQHGFPPSRKAIAVYFDIYPNAAQARVVALADRGKIKVVPGVARGIQVL